MFSVSNQKSFKRKIEVMIEWRVTDNDNRLVLSSTDTKRQGLTLKGPGFFVYLKSGGGGFRPPLRSRPRRDKKFWNLART